MDRELQKLKKITKFMRDHGVLSVKTPEIEIHISPSALILHTNDNPNKQKEQYQDQLSPQEKHDQEMVILLWSAPCFGLEEPN